MSVEDGAALRPPAEVVRVVVEISPTAGQVVAVPIGGDGQAIEGQAVVAWSYGLKSWPAFSVGLAVGKAAGEAFGVCERPARRRRKGGE